MPNNTQELIQKHQAQWVDLRFTDTLGKEHHVTFPADTIDADSFSEGKMFDGSSIHGWKGIEASERPLLPDDSTAVFDPFADHPTIIVLSDVVEPTTITATTVIHALSPTALKST